MIRRSVLPHRSVSKPSLWWILSILISFTISGVAYGQNLLTEWREKLEVIRQLADNDAPKAYQQALSLQKAIPADATPVDRVRMLNSLARIEIILAETETAAVHAQQAFELAKQYNDIPGQSEADINIAWNAVNEGNIDKMIAADTHNLAILGGIDRPDLLVEAMFRGAMMYIRMEKWDQAVAIAVQTMEIAKDSQNPQIRVFGYQAMAVAYDQNARYQESREYYDKMLENAKAMNSKTLQATALLGIGTAYSNSGEFVKGERPTREAIKLYREVGGPFYVARALYCLADNLRRQGRLNDTVPILNEVASIYQQRNNKIGLWWTYILRSTNYQDIGNLRQASADAEQSYRIAKETGFPVYLSKSARRMASIAAAFKHYKRAYELEKEADMTAAKFASEKAGLRVIELANRFEKENRQREINELNRRNQKQAVELERRKLQQRWLWTVIGGGCISLLGTGGFLFRLRRSNLRLGALNAQVLQTKNNLQATLDAIPDPLFELDLEGRFYAYQSPGNDPLIQAEESPVGKNIADVLTDDAALICKSALAEANVAGVSLSKQFNLSTNHVPLWFELSVAAKPSFLGQEPRFIVIARDISGRKSYESALLKHAELEKRQSQFFKIAPGFFFIAVKQNDGNFRLPFASVGLQQLCGLSPEQVQNDAGLLWQMVKPANIEHILQTLELENGETDTMCLEFQVRHPEKGERWIEIHALPQISPEGEVLWYGFMLDITKRKQAEDELRQYKDQLEFTVEQRTQELQLAVQAAEAANKAKSIFLANMSHELRTPLNAILGFSNIVRKNPQIPENELRNIDIIQRSGEHLLNLINDVLEMAKIETGKIELEEEPFDLGRMVQGVTEMMQVRAAEKGLKLVIDQTSEFPRYIVGDEARLSQILINLVGNALKFTQTGAVIIRLGTKNNSYSHLLIEVEDTGSGIALEDRERIFEPFVQLNQPSDSKGTGLGLSITKQFVELMNGQISIDSTLGKGTLFRIDLPLKLVENGELANLRSVKAQEVLGVMPGQPVYRILIVEDQLENQLLLASLMESAGYQVKVAGNGRKGVEIFQNWHPDLIWMDRRMPVMDGVETTKLIRTLPGGTEVKIVGVTASVFSNQRTEMLNAGMDDFVRKPYQANEIFECMSKLLGVRLIYADESKAVSPVVLTGAMLAGLPLKLRQELERALISLDNALINALIKQIKADDEPLFNVLSRLAENFNYPDILKALRDVQQTNE